MSLLEPRCLVCGAPLGRGAPFKKDVRDSEVCSDECYAVYMHNEDDPWTCEICAEKFKNEVDLLAHQRLAEAEAKKRYPKGKISEKV